jgi:Transaldolase/Fructose-6-phosphate aldolase
MRPVRASMRPPPTTITGRSGSRCGARPQRPLWASTGTKNPGYSDVRYVSELVGPGVINTMPEHTLRAFGDHGVAARTLAADPDAAEQTLAAAATVGIDLATARAFVAGDGTKWPKAAAKITGDLGVLLAFSGYPAEHWIHLRTADPGGPALRRRPAPPAGHQGTRLPRRRHRHGLQARRVRPGPLVRGQRTPPGRLGPRRREVRERPARRTIRRIRRRSARRMTKAAVRPVGMSVSGNFRVRFGCLTGGVHGRTQACRVGR